MKNGQPEWTDLALAEDRGFGCGIMLGIIVGIAFSFICLCVALAWRAH